MRCSPYYSRQSQDSAERPLSHTQIRTALVYLLYARAETSLPDTFNTTYTRKRTIILILLLILYTTCYKVRPGSWESPHNALARRATAPRWGTLPLFTLVADTRR